MVLCFLLAVLAGLLISLSGCTAVADSYVEADRRMHDVVAPEWLRYVEEDPAMSEAQVERRRALDRAWEARLRRAEGEAK